MKIPKGEFRRPIKETMKETIFPVLPSFLILVIASLAAYKFVDPAPPKHFVISTGDGESDYQSYAKLYKDVLKDDGIDLEIRPSTGGVENFDRLKDPKSDVAVGFAHDGVGTQEEAPDVSSLGSIYYDPVWVFYRSAQNLTRFSDLIGRKVAVGEAGGGTEVLVTQILKASGVDKTNSQFINLGSAGAAQALRSGQLDASVFLATADDPLIQNMMFDPSLKLMDMDQAEAITRVVPFLHHLILPHGAFDLKKNIPVKDVNLVSATVTLLVRDTLHPALIYLLLKAAAQVHGDPGIFEKKNEFPIDKDYSFTLAEEAKAYYKTGLPFWQKYLPFWLAALVDRFFLVVLPLLAIIIPLVKLIPRLLQWRIKSKIYQHYGELKYLESQLRRGKDLGRGEESLSKLDAIEEKVGRMKVPLDFSDQVYVLREHIHFVRRRLERSLNL
jgi:TRAP transporter TAXI family solute receptor